MRTNMKPPDTNPELAARLIKQWKADPALQEKYQHNAGSFFIRAEATHEWQKNAAVRAEFGGSFERFLAYMESAS